MADFCVALIQLEFYISIKVPSITLQENPLCYSCNKTGGQTDKHIDIMKLKVAFITLRMRVIKTVRNIY